MIKLIKRSFIIISLLIISMTIISGCGTQNSGDKLKESTDFAMDTFVIQKVYGDKADGIIRESINRVKDLEQLFSMYIKGSDIYKINQSAGTKAVKVSTETMEAIKMSLRFSELSEGAYDLTIGTLVNLWGVNSAGPKVPAEQEIKDALNLVNYKDIIVDGNQVRLNKAGQVLDLGSLGKGIACDEVVRMYKEKGVSGLVSVGGNTGAVGLKPDGTSWKIGVRDPRGEANEHIGILSLTDMCAATSGDYERFFEKDGQKYHHIFDPSTGYPSDSGLISATIVAKSGADCDALSTACFVLGLDKGLELLKAAGAEGIFIDEMKNVYVTDGLKNIFSFSGENKGYRIME